MPNVIDLTTVAAVNDILLQDEDVDAAVIQTMITNYSQNVLTRTARRNLSRILSFSESYSGSGSETQLLRNYPILAVSSLSVGGVSIPASTGPTGAGFVLDPSGSQAAIQIRGGGRIGNWSAGESPWRGGGWGNGNAPPLGLPQYRFVEGVQNVLVAYIAGYALEIPAEEADVPATPGPYTVPVANAANFWQDQGVTLSDGTPLEAVSGTPGPGQYAAPAFGVAPLGVYSFNAAQQGVSVNISYSYGGTPYDLAEAAGRLVAVQYRRRQWLGQTSQTQPQVGTTAYSRLETELDTKAVIERYKSRFIA